MIKEGINKQKMTFREGSKQLKGAYHFIGDNMPF